MVVYLSERDYAQHNRPIRMDRAGIRERSVTRQEDPLEYEIVLKRDQYRPDVGDGSEGGAGRRKEFNDTFIIYVDFIYLNGQRSGRVIPFMGHIRLH